MCTGKNVLRYRCTVRLILLKYANLINVIFIFFLSLYGCTNGSDNKYNSNRELYLSVQKINRRDLPVEVSDSTWKLFKEIQCIKPLVIEYDSTRNNGKVSNNVSAQYWLLPSNYKHGINIYTTEIDENDLMHEALHAKLMVIGYPFFYRVRFPEHKTIANIENEIQHYVIYNKMRKLGFAIRTEDVTDWKNGINILVSQMEKIPSNAPEYVLNVMGAAATLGGLNRGISLIEISERLPSRVKSGLDLGVKIYSNIKETNIDNTTDIFQLHTVIASLLELSSKDLVICVIDFKNNNRKYYDPLSGRLLTVKH